VRPCCVGLGLLPRRIEVVTEPTLQLHVPQRSFRCPAVSGWVNAVLNGSVESAKQLHSTFGDYPVLLTRDLRQARAWLLQQTRGERRCGLVAASGARRLRADGLGVLLSATDGHDIAHWYLNRRGDIRSSFALEVPANEFTSQGLELDFIGVCWGGNLLWNGNGEAWEYRRLSGAKWMQVEDDSRQHFIANAYRVLLTRAREGMILWVPRGDQEDTTRDPARLDDTARYLELCGARRLGA